MTAVVMAQAVMNAARTSLVIAQVINRVIRAVIIVAPLATELWAKNQPLKKVMAQGAAVLTTVTKSARKMAHVLRVPLVTVPQAVVSVISLTQASAQRTMLNVSAMNPVKILIKQYRAMPLAK